MVEQVSFNTSGNDKILVHLTKFFTKQALRFYNGRSPICLSQNSRLFGEKYMSLEQPHKWIGFVYRS